MTEYEKYMQDIEDIPELEVMCMQGTKIDYLEPSTPHVKIEITTDLADAPEDCK